MVHSSMEKSEVRVPPQAPIRIHNPMGDIEESKEELKLDDSAKNQTRSFAGNYGRIPERTPPGINN